MGQVDRDRVQGFLSARIKDADFLRRLMDLLEPFFVRAESGRYQLAPESGLDHKQVGAAIAQATGKEVTQIVFVSLERSSPGPSWMTEEVHQKGLVASLGGSLQDSLLSTFMDNLMLSLAASLWGGLRCSNLGLEVGSFVSNPQGTIEKDPLHNLWASLWASLEKSLFYFLDFAIAGRTEEVERLVPLLELLPKAIPLGVMKDKPGVWVVLVA